MTDLIVTGLVSMLGGAGVVELIRWLRYRRTDDAISQKHLSEAGAARTTADANWLTVSSKELAIWIATASESKMVIIELTSKCKELEHALGLCKATVEAMARERRGGH